MKNFILFITIVALLIFVGTFIRATMYMPEREIYIALPHGRSYYSNIATAADLKIENEPPERLIISKLGINAQVQHVGINENGRMSVPNNFADVGWYKYGTIPGETGSAVFAGHVNNGLSLSGVFSRLNDLTVGDLIVVETINGNTINFIVDDIAEYDYKNTPTEDIFNMNDRARLRLITCEGEWISWAKTYSRRLVVSGILLPN